MSEEDCNRVYAKTLFFFKSGLIGSAFVEREGSVAAPIPIRNLEGNVVSWFVPVIVLDRIAGFFQFTKDLEFLRYASFQKNMKVDDFPLAASWIDLGTIQKKIAGLIRENEIASTPFLTYDGNISKIAWGIKITNSKGDQRVIYVAGDYVYPQRRTSKEITGAS